MEKIRGYELSKAFGIPSKEIVKVLHDYGVSDKNHMSALTEYELDVIFEYYTQKNQVPDFSMYAPKKKEEPKKREDSSAEATDGQEETYVATETEVVRKTRTVDTRVNTVDLDRLDDEKNGRTDSGECPQRGRCQEAENQPEEKAATGQTARG